MKIAVVTPFFPTSAQKFRGHSAFQTLKPLRQWAEIEVFVPISAYPAWFQPRNFLYVRPDLNYCPPEFRTHYFEYPAIPGISRPVNGEVCARYLDARLRKSNADLVLNYWIYPEGYAAVRIAHKLGIPAIVWAIGSDLNSIPDPITRWFTRRTLEMSDFVLTVSHQLTERALELGSQPDKVRTIANGCDSSIFHPADRSAARVSLGILPEDALLVFVGRLEIAKGVFELLEAVRLLHRDRPHLRLAYVGEGNARARLEARVREAGLAERVIFPGPTDSRGVAQWLAAANVFTLPSYAEGCPNVVIEALNCGRPVVAANVGAIPEMVDADSGILLAPRNAAALAGALGAALDRAWNEPEIAVRSQRTWDDVARETLAICEAVHQRFRRGRRSA